MKDRLITNAITALQQGLLVVYPTDTLYALGASIYLDQAVDRVFSLKQRPTSIPLPVAVASVDAICDIASMNEMARMIADVFLPGPLTLILSKRPVVSDHVNAGKASLAIRVPADPIASELLSSIGPVTATSANIHQHPPAFTVPEIQSVFVSDDIAVFLDDGRRSAPPSTIIA